MPLLNEEKTMMGVDAESKAPSPPLRTMLKASPLANENAGVIIQMGMDRIPCLDDPGAQAWRERALFVWSAIVTALCHKRDAANYPMSVTSVIEHLALDRIEALYLEGYCDAQVREDKAWAPAFLGIKDYLESNLPAYSVEKLLKKQGFGSDNTVLQKFDIEQDGIVSAQHSYRVSLLVPILNDLAQIYEQAPALAGEGQLLVMSTTPSDAADLPKLGVLQPKDAMSVAGPKKEFGFLRKAAAFALGGITVAIVGLASLTVFIYSTAGGVSESNPSSGIPVVNNTDAIKSWGGIGVNGLAMISDIAQKDGISLKAIHKQGLAAQAKPFYIFSRHDCAQCKTLEQAIIGVSNSFEPIIFPSALDRSLVALVGAAHAYCDQDKALSWLNKTIYGVSESAAPKACLSWQDSIKNVTFVRSMVGLNDVDVGVVAPNGAIYAGDLTQVDIARRTAELERWLVLNSQ